MVIYHSRIRKKSPTGQTKAYMQSFAIRHWSIKHIAIISSRSFITFRISPVTENQELMSRCLIFSSDRPLSRHVLDKQVSWFPLYDAPKNTHFELVIPI